MKVFVPVVEVVGVVGVAGVSEWVLLRIVLLKFGPSVLISGGILLVNEFEQVI